MDVLGEADGTFRKWADAAEPVCRSGEDIAAAPAAAFESDPDGAPAEHREKPEVMNGVHSDTACLHRWSSTLPSGEARVPRAREADGAPTRQVWRSAMEALTVPQAIA